MDLQAEDLVVGNVIQDGGWGAYRIVKIVNEHDNNWIRCFTKQGNVERVFVFSKSQTVYGVQ